MRKRLNLSRHQRDALVYLATEQRNAFLRLPKTTRNSLLRRGLAIRIAGEYVLTPSGLDHLRRADLPETL